MWSSRVSIGRQGWRDADPAAGFGRTAGPTRPPDRDRDTSGRSGFQFSTEVTCSASPPEVRIGPDKSSSSCVTLSSEKGGTITRMGVDDPGRRGGHDLPSRWHWPALLVMFGEAS